MATAGLRSPNELADEYTFHFDKSFYVTGEIIWYKVYLPYKFRNYEISFDVRLIDNKGHTVDHIFLNNRGKQYLSGYVKIPLTWQSGLYNLLVHATNNEIEALTILSKAPIPIYNDLQEESIPEHNITEPGLISNNNDETTSLEISLDWNQDTVYTRGKATGTISVSDEQGNPVRCNLSISIIDSELSGNGVLNQGTVIHMPDTHSSSADDFSDRLSLKARLTTESGATLGSKILGIYSSKEKKLDYTMVYSDGWIYFEFEDFYGTKPIHFHEIESNDIKISFQDKYEIHDHGQLPYNEAITDYLALSRKRKKTYQYHNLTEQIIEKTEEIFVETEHKDFRRIRMDEFDSFEDLPTFLHEVRTPLKLELKKDGMYEADFFIYRHGEPEINPLPPLFIVDGKMTRDVNFIAHLDITTIEEMTFYRDLLKLRSEFGTMGQYGVAVIKTVHGDQKIPDVGQNDFFNVAGYQRPVDFPISKLENQFTQPLIRPLIYWNPELHTDSQGRVVFTFHQTDDLGRFKIMVLAQSEHGEVVQKSWNYDAVFRKDEH